MLGGRSVMCAERVLARQILHMILKCFHTEFSTSKDLIFLLRKRAIPAKIISVDSIQSRQSNAISLACVTGIQLDNNSPNSPSRMPKPPGVRKLKKPTIHAKA